MKLYWTKRRINFFFRNQNYINRFTNYMLWSVKLIPQGVYVKLGKDQPIDDFMTYIFKSFTRIRENFSIKIWWNFMWFFKNLILLYRFMTSVTKRIWLITSWWLLRSDIEFLTPKTVELFSLPKAILPLLSALYQSCGKKNLQTFLANSIVPDLFKRTLLSFKCLSMSVVSMWSTKVISRSLHMFISPLFVSGALSFRHSFRGTISDIVTVFVSDFTDSAMSTSDLDIWLAVLLLFSSFVPTSKVCYISMVPTSSIMWFGLNSRIIGLAWPYI